MKKLLAIYCLILAFGTTVTAQSNHCGCIISHIPKLELAEMFFPPSAVKKENIHSLVVTSYKKSTIENDEADPLNLNGKQQQVLLFDKDGYLRSAQDFYSHPKLHKQTDFKRNTVHQIIQKISFPIDSLGDPRPNSSKTIIDISYPDEFTVKTKNRGFKGDILPDSISVYAIFKKDKQNRQENILTDKEGLI